MEEINCFDETEIQPTNLTKNDSKKEKKKWEIKNKVGFTQMNITQKAFENDIV